MKIIIIVLALVFNAQVAAAITIATGSSEGTYFKIAQDIKKVAGKEGLKLDVISTNGSFENINLLGNGKTDLAIVQKDALNYFADVMKEKGDKNIFRSVKVILNLYPEEVHVITNNKAITSFRDLEGKKVSVGAENSGSLLTAEMLLRAYKVKVKKLHYHPDRAIGLLRKGELDAMIFVGGAPVSAFKNLGKQFRIVRLPENDGLNKVYQRKILGKDFYSWANSDYATYAVPSVIVTLARREEKYIADMGRLVLAILTNKGKLESSGHPKWKKSLLQNIYADVGYPPTNDFIQIFNILDAFGYKIIKK
jgi:TRAP transporter TAXI family solute receptor